MTLHDDSLYVHDDRVDSLFAISTVLCELYKYSIIPYYHATKYQLRSRRASLWLTQWENERDT